MSSFIVSDGTISRVVELLDLDTMSMEIKRRNSMGGGVGDKLGRELWQLNSAATGWRYSTEPDKLPAFKYKPNPHLTPAALVKAAHCWMYQCSEGEFEEHELFIRVKAYTQRVESAIVGSLRGYETAEWDAPWALEAIK
jgi:hypothetical protein